MSGRLAARQVIVLAAAFSLVGGLAAQRAIIRSGTPQYFSHQSCAVSHDRNLRRLERDRG
jgi:hypothetical protein